MHAGGGSVGSGNASSCLVEDSPTLAKHTTAVLPREIEYMIIEHTQDKQTLLCCSLVCRAWLQVSRACLFHTITLRVPDQADLRLHAFARFLQAPGRSNQTCCVETYVRDLTILGDKAFRPSSSNTDLEGRVHGLPVEPEQDPPLRCNAHFELPIDSSPSSSSRSSSSDGDTDSGYSSFLSDDPPLICGSLSDDTSPSYSVLYPWAKTALLTSGELMSDTDEDSVADTASEEGADSDAQDVTEDHVRLSIHSLHVLLSLLPSLETLCLDKLSLYDGALTTRYVTAAPETLGNKIIKRLYIEDCTPCASDGTHLFAVLALFSEVQMLCIDGGPLGIQNSGTISHIPIVRSLVLGALEEADAITFYDSLRSSGSLDGPLKFIRFTGLMREEVAAFFAFAQDAGEHLVDLELDIYYAINDSPGLPESWESLTLDFCSRLEKLTFSFDFEDEDQPAWVCLEVVRTCLRFYAHLLSSRSVQRTLRIVTFQVFRAPAAPYNFRRSAESSSVPRWAELDNALAGLLELSHVKFMLCDVDGRGAEVDETKAGMAAFLQQYMPRMWSSGRVRISLEEEEVGEAFLY